MMREPSCTVHAPSSVRPNAPSGTVPHRLHNGAPSSANTQRTERTRLSRGGAPVRQCGGTSAGDSRQMTLDLRITKRTAPFYLERLEQLVRQAVAIIECGRICEAAELMRAGVACPPPAFVHPNLRRPWPPRGPRPGGDPIAAPAVHQAA